MSPRLHDGVKRYVKVPVTQNQFDALTSLTYNIGKGKEGFGGSTLLKLLNQGDYKGAAEQFHRWNKVTDPKTGEKVESPGLINRRKADYELFIKDSD
jgi:lysozyme